MTILSDRQIIAQCDKMVDAGQPPMIAPYLKSQVKKVAERKLISFGVSSYGYDVTLQPGVKVFRRPTAEEIEAGLEPIDPKRFDGEKYLQDAEVHKDEDGSEYVILPPNNYLMGVTVEYFNIPRDIMIMCVGKSTYARVCNINNVTPIEPGFKGNVVIEVANGCGWPVRVYLNEGIAQFLFFRGNEECRTSYADRDGKYQGQTGVTNARV